MNEQANGKDSICGADCSVCPGRGKCPGCVATDGCPYIVDRKTDQAYRLTDEDQARLWEMFEQIKDAMGYDASVFMEW